MKLLTLCFVMIGLFYLGNMIKNILSGTQASINTFSSLLTKVVRHSELYALCSLYLQNTNIRQNILKSQSLRLRS